MDINKPKNASQIEFIALIALTMSMAALTIDMILPAMSEIGHSLGVKEATSVQLLITMIFLGLGIGQLIFGPLSDSFGRKPMVFIGVIVYLIASFICVIAPNLEWMVAGRILQGIGLSGPRSVSIAIVRDAYKGDLMARIMSFVSIVFILVPIIAPSLGQFILYKFDWPYIFYFQIIFSLIIVTWFMLRQPETLPKANRIRFNRRLFINGLLELIKFKRTLAFTLISGLITGAFMVYLSSSQLVFTVQYDLKDTFPFIFAGLALMLGISTFLNGSLVMKWGMKRLTFNALCAYCLISLIYVVTFWQEPNPSIFVVLSFLALQFFSIGFIFGNLNAITMEPIGHIAGIGAAITGAISTVMAVPLGTYIGSFMDKTVWPLFFGFLICGILSLIIFKWSDYYEIKHKIIT